MGYRIVRRIEPRGPLWGRVLLVILSLAEVALAVSFVWRFVTAGGPGYLLGVQLALQAIILGFIIALLGRYYVPYTEAAEDREDEILW